MLPVELEILATKSQEDKIVVSLELIIIEPRLTDPSDLIMLFPKISSKSQKLLLNIKHINLLEIF